MEMSEMNSKMNWASAYSYYIFWKKLYKTGTNYPLNKHLVEFFSEMIWT